MTPGPARPAAAGSAQAAFIPSGSGFTLMASLGLGYAPGVTDGHTKAGGLVNLGLGYTWRRRPTDRGAGDRATVRTATD